MMPRKRKHVEAVRSPHTTKVPFAVGALTLLILLVAFGDVAGAQASTFNTLAANMVQSILSPSAVDAKGPGAKGVVVPPKPTLRSPYQPPSWTPGPPPWAPGKPDWVPGPPPWASNKVNNAQESTPAKAKR